MTFPSNPGGSANEICSVHTTDEYRYPLGSVFGWRSEESPTGWLSGIVVGHGPCLVKVQDVRPGIRKEVQRG